MSTGVQLQAQPEYVEVVLFPIGMPYLISPILSGIATFIVIVCCIIFKSYKEPLGLMIFGITISDFAFCYVKTVYSIWLPSTDFMCKLAQGIGQYGVVSSVLWGAFFGHALLLITRSFQIDVLKTVTKYYLFFAVTVPLGLATLSIMTDYVVYENVNGVERCIHKVYKGSVDVTFAVFTTIPLLIGCILSIVWYAMAAKKLKQVIQGDNAKHLLTLIVYPAIMLGCWLPVLGNFTLSPFGLESSAETRALFQAIDQMQGLLDALIYGGSKHALITKFFLMLFCKKRRASNAVEMQNSGRSNSSTHDDMVTGYDPEEKTARVVSPKVSPGTSPKSMTLKMRELEI